MASWMIATPEAEMTGDVAATVIDLNEQTDIPTEGGEGPGGLWWDRIHVIPRSIELGNVISTVLVPLDVFNAFRVDKTWNALDIFADGVTVNNPSLPTNLSPFEGISMTVTVSAEGEATVDGTLEFTFGALVIVVPITFQRIDLVPFMCLTGVIEELAWRTMINTAKDGTEQRMATRRRPRQILTYDVEVEDGPERQRVDNLLFANLGRIVGVPVWHDQTRLSAAETAGSTTLDVYSAQNADYRVGGTAVVWASETNFELVTIASVGSTTIGLDSPLVGSYAANSTIVAPVRAAYLVGVVPSSREVLGLATYRMTFQVTDNDVELASTAGWNTYLGKVLLDGFNFVEQADEQWARVVEVIDGETGLLEVQLLEPSARRSSVKGFVTESPAQLWQMRQLLHALRGRQVSFYLPTFAEDFTPVANLTSGTATMNIVNVGYNDYVDANGRVGRNHLRVVKTDGTTVSRMITGASVIDPTTEQISVDANWASTINLADIERVEILEKVRFDSDVLQIRHGELAGDARMAVPVKAVLE